MVISERYTNEMNKKAPKKWRGPFMITEVHQQGRFYRLSTGHHFFLVEFLPASNLNLIFSVRSTGTSMDTFVRGMGVGLTHTEHLIVKKLRITRETGDIEAETGEEPQKPDIGRVVESYFDSPNSIQVAEY